jgi:TPR repeat protein
MLGECAYYGYDEDIDYEKAAKYYLQAAQKYVNALIRLGDMYLHGEYLPLDPAFANELYNHVRMYEEYLYKKNGIYSDANEMVLHRLDNMERAEAIFSTNPITETNKQALIRKKLMEIIEEDREKWKRWGIDL